MDFDAYFEHKMRFIVDTLADVAIRQDKADIRAQAAERRADRADARLDKLERQMQGIQKLVKTGMRMIVKSQEEYRVADRELKKELKELAAAQKRTESLFQRWLTGKSGSNGHRRHN